MGTCSELVGEGIRNIEVKRSWGERESRQIYSTLAVMNSCAAFASAKLQFEEK